MGKKENLPDLNYKTPKTHRSACDNPTNCARWQFRCKLHNFLAFYDKELVLSLTRLSFPLVRFRRYRPPRVTNGRAAAKTEKSQDRLTMIRPKMGRSRIRVRIWVRGVIDLTLERGPVHRCYGVIDVVDRCSKMRLSVKPEKSSLLHYCHKDAKL